VTVPDVAAGAAPVALGNGARFAAAPLAEGGTTIQAWMAADPLPLLDLDECPGLVVVAPHPDDETLGLGATMAQLTARGVEVTVVSVTDGGGAYPECSALAQAQLEATRRDELYLATRLLGANAPISLGLPDGRVSDEEDRLATLLADILSDASPGTWCAATWRGDGHPDHEAVGRAAARASTATATILVEYPVWMWHWAIPADPVVPWDRCYAVPMDPAAVERKRQAAGCFRSQFTAPSEFCEAVLPAFVLPRLIAVGEVLFR
jgi:LmbE family N-acetylglucosaminyl deacetylase